MSEKNKTPFVTYWPPVWEKVNTRYGMYQIVSLFFYLNPVRFTTNIIPNTPELATSSFTT